MTALAIIDAGYGNLQSIRAAFQRIGVEPAMAADPAIVADADMLVLPGVGAARFAMRRLAELGLIDALKRRCKPTLGICLGMQLLFERSDEGDTECLGVLPGSVRALRPGPGLPVPHMGWSRIDHATDGLGLKAGDYVYFAHGYACDDTPATVACATYGGPVTAVVKQGPVWGAQFHPERSSTAGAAFLKAFISQ